MRDTLPDNNLSELIKQEKLREEESRKKYVKGVNISDRFSVYLILIGLIIIAINIPISTGKSYGFIIGEYEGVSLFAVTQYVMTYVGQTLSIDLFFDPLGYLLIIMGMLRIGKNYQTKKAISMSIFAIVLELVKLFSPFFINVKKLALPITVIFLLEILCIAVVMYSFASMCTAKIDNYKYMNVGQDLRFGAELYAICIFISEVLYLFEKVGWYFANILHGLVMAAAVITMLYYVYKAYKYQDIYVKERESGENEQ